MALLGVHFNARGFQGFGEVGVLEVAVVPRIALAALKGGSELVVDGRTVAPIHRAERLLEPDVVPIAVARDALEVHIDTGFGQRLLEDLTRVGSARESALGYLQFNRAGVARFLVVELGFVNPESVTS